MVLGPRLRHPSLVFTHMVTTSILVCFLGTFLLYSTSAKMRSVNTEFQGMSEAQAKLRKLMGLALIIVSYLVLGIYAGFVAAAIYFLLILTFAASMLILLYPLKVFNKLSLAILFVVSLAIELFI